MRPLLRRGEIGVGVKGTEWRICLQGGVIGLLIDSSGRGYRSLRIWILVGTCLYVDVVLSCWIIIRSTR